MTHRLSRVVVAIPAKNEQDLLPECLMALARQRDVDMRDVTVLVCCNNCTDDTAGAALALARRTPYALVAEAVDLPETMAHAGGARRRAMDLADALCALGGLILTTDADGKVDDGWIAAYDAAFALKVDLVAGRVSTEWEQLRKFPAAVLEVGAREWEYQGLCAELEALCDPEPHDPWPRHNQTCGANLGITKSAYGAIGGLPILRTGEDSALVREVWRRDGRVRHDPGPHVTVSARLIGRAQGGMADALSSRHGEDYLCDDLLEPAHDLMQRALWRHAARNAFEAGALAQWASSVGAQLNSTHATFGDAWLAIESDTPVLAKRRLSVPELERELTRIGHLLAQARDSRLTFEAAS